MARMSPTTSRRFEWVNDPDGAWIEIVHLPDTVEGDIVARHSTMVALPAGDGDGYEMAERRLPRQIREGIAIAAVKAWGGFKGEDGQDQACTPENIRCWCGDTAFVDFLRESRKTLAAEVKKQRESLRKN